MSTLTSPLRAPFDYEIQGPQITTEEANRAALGQGGGFAGEASMALRRFGTGRSTASLASDALSAELSGDQTAAQRLLTTRDQLLRSGAGTEARVPEFTGIRSAGDAAEWLGSTLGEGVPSMAPTLAAALATRGLLGRAIGAAPASAAGALPMSFSDLRSGEIDAQYSDPALAAAPAQQRADVATGVALGGAALEALVPGKIAAGMARGPVARAVIGEGVPEAFTEAGQSAISQIGQQQLDPTRDLSVEQLVNAGAAGFGVGTAVGAAARVPGAIASALPQRSQPAAPPSTAPAAPAPAPDAPIPVAPSPFDTYVQRAQDLAGEVATRATAEAKDLAGEVSTRAAPTVAKAKDFVTETMTRASEAAQTARSPQEFVQRVFGGSPAEMDAMPEAQDPRVLSAPDPEAALLERDAGRSERAGQYAQQLMEDLATPDNVRAELSKFQSDYSSPAARDYVTSVYAAQETGKRITNAVADVVEWAGKAGAKLSERITRNNLQDLPLLELQPLVQQLTAKLGPNAADAPKLARQLVAASARLQPANMKIDENVDRRLRNLSEVVDDKTLDLVTELSGSDGLRSAIARIRAIPTAYEDARTAKGSSFMESLLTSPLSAPELKNVARFVDELGIKIQNLNPKLKAESLMVLKPVFGSVKNAQTVVEYYGNLRREAIKRDAEQNPGVDDRPESEELRIDGAAQADDTYEGVEGDLAVSPDLSEAPPARLRAQFRTPNSARPFMRATELGEFRKALKAARAKDPNARKMTLRDYVEATGQSAPTVAAKVRNDLLKRLREDESRDTETVQQALRDLDTVPAEMRNDEYRALYESLRTRKTEARPNLPKLRRQAKVLENASGVTFSEILALSKRVQNTTDAGEKTKLQKQLDKLENKYAANADKVLERMYVIATLESDAVTAGMDRGASDETVEKYRKLLDAQKKPPERKKGEPDDAYNERLKAVTQQNALLQKTRIGFNMKGQKQPLYLSAESMVHESKLQGSTTQRLAESISNMLARDDVEGLIPPSPDTIIMRRDDGNHLTWGQISPTVKSGKFDAARAAKKRWAKEQRKKDAADQETVVENELDALDDDSAEAKLQFLVGKLVAEPAKPGASFNEKALRKARLAKARELMDEALPLPQKRDVEERLAETEAASGSYAPEGNMAVDILHAEETLEALNDRLDMVQDVPELADTVLDRINQTETQIDKAASAVPVEKRVRDVLGRREQEPRRVTKQSKVEPATSKTLSDAAVAALYDVAVNENYARLNTPEKVVKYAAMARGAMEALRQIPEDSRTEQQEALLAKLRADFDQSKQSAFDWNSLFDGMEPTDAQRAELKSVVSKQSAARPGNARITPADKKAIRDEILRTRGDQVKVRFREFANLGASGQFSMNRDKTGRLIEIALQAESPIGVARHEALHDFFAMLGEDKTGRSIKKDLVDASNAPQVRRQLRELLKDHPEARAQMEQNAEERVAYMYQFWAAGELTVLGPTGAGIFERLRRFFREMLKLISTEQRAEDLLTALHDGKFADPSTVAEVLADMPADRYMNHLDKQVPALTRGMRAVFDAAPDRLRNFQNEKLTELADMFSSEEGSLGFIQRRFQQQGVWTNELAKILDKTTSQERRAAIENMQKMLPPSSQLEKQLATFFADMHTYMADAGVKTMDSETKKWVPMRRVDNYFPRVFDRSAIMKDRDAFIELLKRHGKMDTKAANNAVNALIHGTGQLELAENEHALGFTPYAQAVQDRKFTFITPANAAEFAKFQVKDLADITTSYVQQATHRAEYARMFDNNGEVITKMIVESGITNAKELEEVGRIVQGLEGSLGHEMSTTTKELMAGVMTLQNLVILPLALFSQMIDPVVLAARSGDIKDAGKAYMTAIKRLARNRDEAEDMAEMLGIISQDSVLEAMGVAHGTAHMSRGMRNINRVFFKYNGMQGWNNSMRIAATAAGERYLLANKDNETALAELGLKPGDVRTVANGKLDVTDPKIREAMYRFVDGAVLRPSASNRPLWMSDPRFILIAHLKQFTFAMHNVVLKRANRELDNDNPKPWMVLMLAMPVILASDMTKFAMMGNLPENWGFMDYMTHAIERSGLLGLGDFGVQAMRDVDVGEMPGQNLLGPAAEHLTEILQWVGGDPMTDAGDVVDRTIPGARFL